MDGTPLTGFVPTKSNYNVSLPLGTTAAPTVTWESAYAPGVQQINLLNNSLEEGAQIQVSIPNTSYSKTYKLTYKIEQDRPIRTSPVFSWMAWTWRVLRRRRPLIP